MEYDEVYHEKNQVHRYLSSFEEFSGCYDVTKIQRNDNLEVGLGLGLAPSTNMPRHRPTVNAWYYKLDNKTLFHQICKILECGLILEEDAHYIENIADLCQPPLPLHYELGWKSKLFFIGSSVLASSGAFFYTTSRYLSLSFGMASVSVAIWEYYQVMRKQRQVQLIEELLSVLHEMFKVLKKSTRLIEENEILVRGNILAISAGVDFSSLPSHTAKCRLMIPLRSSLSNTVQQTVTVFTNGTRQLIKAIPLAGQLNFSQSCLATLDDNPLNLLKLEDDLPLGTLKDNTNIYLLLQSEFLRRLALCFCPKLWLNNSPQQLRDVASITTVVTSEMSQLSVNLNREYQAFYSYGLNDKTKSKPLQSSWKYSDVYVATHSAVLHLQAMLLKTRTIEELLEKNCIDHTEDFLENIENALEDVMKESDSFESCCRESIVQVRKLKIVKTQIYNSKPIIPETEDVVEEHSIGTEDYVVEDEVFEATSFDNELSKDDNCDVILSKEERVKREIERQLSRRMVKELKTVLVSKSTEWKERERRALLKKAGLDPSTVEELSPLTEVPCSEGEWPLPRLKTGLPKKYSSSCSSRRRSSLDIACILAVVESDTSGEAASPQPPPLPPPPPPLPPPSLPDNYLQSPTTLEIQEEMKAKRIPFAMEDVSKGAGHFWSVRNQCVEETFSGSGENLQEELGDISKDEDIT